MLPQESLIARLHQLAMADGRVVAAMLYGSFAAGEGDRFSDIDCILFIVDATLPAFKRRDWIAQLAPVAIFYRNEFGNDAVVFEHLVRGEFHFYPAGQMAAKVSSWQGTVFFPALEKTILVDKTGELARHLSALVGSPPGRDTPADVQYLRDSFLNWFLFGVNVLARGELARALEILHLVQDNLLRMVRIQEGTDHHWLTPTRAAEQELSAAAYAHLVACTAALNRDALFAAYRAAWQWGQSLLLALTGRHEIDGADNLMTKMDDYFLFLQTETRSE